MVKPIRPGDSSQGRESHPATMLHLPCSPCDTLAWEIPCQSVSYRVGPAAAVGALLAPPVWGQIGQIAPRPALPASSAVPHATSSCLASPPQPAAATCLHAMITAEQPLPPALYSVRLHKCAHLPLCLAMAGRITSAFPFFPHPLLGSPCWPHGSWEATGISPALGQAATHN